MVGLAFVEQFWQEWTLHVTVVKIPHVPECVEIAKESQTWK